MLVASAGNIFAYFLAFFGRKYTVATAGVLAFVATTITMIVCMKSILTGVIALIVMPAWIATFIAWLIPSNFIAVVSAILSGKICKAAYNVINTKIDLITKAS